jgi:hypothetical protein
MPGIAHVFLGALIALILYNFNSAKFTRKHAFIFTINSYLGPDLAGIIGIGSGYALGHSVLGWPIWCLWMIPVYSFLTRFRLDEKHLQLQDEGPDSKLRLNWLQTYLLVVAGGLFHFTVDITVEKKNIWSLGIEDNPWKISIDTFIQSLHYTRPATPFVGEIAIILVITMFFLFNYGMRQADEGKSKIFINFLVVLSVILYIFLSLIFGINNVAGNEPDLGAMIYFSVFICLPFGLCLLSSKDISNSKSSQDYMPRPEFKLKLVILFFFGIAGSLLLVLILFTIDKKNNFSTLLNGANYSIISFISTNFIYLTLGIAFIVTLFILVGIILSVRNPNAQRFAMILFVISGILIVPLGFWGLLREKEVLALFDAKMKT